MVKSLFHPGQDHLPGEGKRQRTTSIRG